MTSPDLKSEKFRYVSSPWNFLRAGKWGEAREEGKHKDLKWQASLLLKRPADRAARLAVPLAHCLGAGTPKPPPLVLHIPEQALFGLPHVCPLRPASPPTSCRHGQHLLELQDSAPAFHASCRPSLPGVERFSPSFTTPLDLRRLPSQHPQCSPHTCVYRTFSCAGLGP